jgi:hypothetical protein
VHINCVAIILVEILIRYFLAGFSKKNIFESEMFESIKILKDQMVIVNFLPNLRFSEFYPAIPSLLIDRNEINFFCFSL